jgi:hypothetical protein
MSVFLSFSITLIIALSLWKFGVARKERRSYPAGPKPLPLIGNLLHFPTKDVANVYLEWGKKYNDELNELSCRFLTIGPQVASSMQALLAVTSS